MTFTIEDSNDGRYYILGSEIKNGWNIYLTHTGKVGSIEDFQSVDFMFYSREVAEDVLNRYLAKSAQ